MPNWFFIKVQEQFSGRIAFPKNGARAIGHTQAKKMNLNVTQYTKINSKQITDLNIKTTNLPEKRQDLWDLRLSKEFLDLTQKYILQQERLINWASLGSTAFAL